MEFRCLYLCGKSEESTLQQGMEQFTRQTGQYAVSEWYHRREDLMYRIRDGVFDAVIVALPGALGMEAVMGVRESAPSIPLIWCSDDDVFALQGYRLRITSFLRLPVHADQMCQSLIRCVHVL